MPAAPDATADHIKDVNTRYHDVAADSYDGKWGIDFGEIGRAQVTAKLAKALGHPLGAPFGDALEIGAGTGYFSLNLLASGAIVRATATDISPGMLGALSTNAERMGLEVRTVRTEAETLPFPDESFDLVFGHAVLHHIPDLDKAASEFMRVLQPGGTVAFCGEPSRYGDRLAAIPKRAAVAIAPLWRRLVGAAKLDHEAAAAAADAGEHALESEVDVHAFDPAALQEVLDGAGFEATRVKGEELLANLHGWTMRTIESTAEPEQIPIRWRKFAFDSYIALQKLDTRFLEPHLPPALFYNLVLSARKPG